MLLSSTVLQLSRLSFNFISIKGFRVAFQAARINPCPFAAQLSIQTAVVVLLLCGMHYHRNTSGILNIQVVTLSHDSFFHRMMGTLKSRLSSQRQKQMSLENFRSVSVFLPGQILLKKTELHHKAYKYKKICLQFHKFLLYFTFHFKRQH